MFLLETKKKKTFRILGPLKFMGHQYCEMGFLNNVSWLKSIFFFFYLKNNVQEKKQSI